MFSKIRLDAVSGTYNIRGYLEGGDPLVSLAEETREYCTVGSLVIAGNVAVVTAVTGPLSDPDIWSDFEEELKSRGVTEVRWERHKNGKVILKKRRIK